MGGSTLVAPIRLCGLVPDPSVVFGLGLLSESVSGEFLAWVYRLTVCIAITHYLCYRISHEWDFSRLIAVKYLVLVLP